MPLPPNFSLVILDVATGIRYRLADPVFGVEFYMRIPAHQTIEEMRQKSEHPLTPELKEFIDRAIVPCLVKRWKEKS